MTVFVFDPSKSQAKALLGTLGITVDDSGDPVLLSGGGSKTQFTQTATVTVTNTVVETSLAAAGIGSLTLPANSLAVGRELRLDLWGQITTDATTPGTLNIKIKMGSTVILQTGAKNLPTNFAGNLLHLEARITVRSAGAGGTVIGQGRLSVFANATAFGTEGNVVLTNNLSTVAVNTTVSQLLDITATFGTALATNIISATSLSVETLN